MDSYNAELERVANVLRSIPGKLSEPNVRRLGVHNHFETFEDQIPTDINTDGVNGNASKGKRLSLSGSTVVIDIDFSSPHKVENVSVSLSSKAPPDARYSAMASTNKPSEHLLGSLKEQRLNNFARMLGFLSRCDRFSTKDVDCFRALDLISEAIHVYVEHTKSEEFGQLQVNPPSRLGLGMLYYGQSHYAYLDVMVGNRRDYCLRMFPDITGWLDTTTFTWNKNIPTCEYDTRAELALSLDPPVAISDALAQQWKAIVSDENPPLEKQKWSATFTLSRHPRYATNASSCDEFEIFVGNMFPFRFHVISQLPISSPVDIPNILSRLRQFALANDLIQSLLRGPEVAASNEVSDLNIADALSLIDQPVHKKRTVLNVSLCYNDPNIVLDVSWVLADFQMTVTIGPGGNIKIDIRPETPTVNMDDLQRLIVHGNLALAISYALSSCGRLHRRSTTSITG